jgi:hypothetical protein
MKTRKKASKAQAKKRVSAKRPTRAVKKAAVKGFFATGRRGPRGLNRSPLHVLLTPEERSKLVQLTHQMRLNAADVVRALIAKAK